LDTKRYGNFEVNIQDSKAVDNKINVIVQLNEGQKSVINKIKTVEKVIAQPQMQIV
jgi:hypothetical protein